MFLSIGQSWQNYVQRLTFDRPIELLYDEHSTGNPGAFPVTFNAAENWVESVDGFGYLKIPETMTQFSMSPSAIDTLGDNTFQIAVCDPELDAKIATYFFRMLGGIVRNTKYF